MLLPIEAKKKGQDMSSEWFYQNNNNKEIGPFSAVDLKSLAKEGIINKETLIKKGNGSWVKGVVIKGLFNSKVDAKSKDIREAENNKETNSTNEFSGVYSSVEKKKLKKEEIKKYINIYYFIVSFSLVILLGLPFVCYLILSHRGITQIEVPNVIKKEKLIANNFINRKENKNDVGEDLEQIRDVAQKNKILKIEDKNKNDQIDINEQKKEEKKRKDFELMEKKKQYLLTRPSDVMGACWGDSIENVSIVFSGKFDKIYEETVDGLINSEKLQGCVKFNGTIKVDFYEMYITYCFFNNKLVSVTLFMFDKFSNKDPFGCYLKLLGVIESKYGKGDFLDLGNSKNFIWTTPRHLIRLDYAGGLPSSVTVEYNARSSDFEVYQNFKKTAYSNLQNNKMNSLKKGF